MDIPIKQHQIDFVDDKLRWISTPDDVKYEKYMELFGLYQMSRLTVGKIAHHLVDETWYARSPINPHLSDEALLDELYWKYEPIHSGNLFKRFWKYLKRQFSTNTINFSNYE